LYVEGNTTPFHDGVSRRIPEANTDAGTALNRSGEGRIQVSELRLIWPIFQGSHVHLGLLDATGFLDVSQIANDENLFFLGGPFVNNPTIEFPDYALGAGLDGGLTDNGRILPRLDKQHSAVRRVLRTCAVSGYQRLEHWRP
jgi:hypothetical protein